MYKYSEKVKNIVKKRVEQFRFQVERRLNGDLTEEEFKPLRLMNGLYLQLHAYLYSTTNFRCALITKIIKVKLK